MAIGANTAWEVDLAVGSDANGGGFNWGVAAPGTDKTYGAGQLVTPGARADLAIAAVAAPAAPAPTTATTGGTIPASTTYFVVVSYLVLTGGETAGSAEASVATGSGTATNTVTVPSPAAATPAGAGNGSYHVYFGATTGGPYYRQTTGPGQPIGTPWTQVAPATLSGTNPPTAATTTANILATSSSPAFDATDAGNTINVASGTGWTTGFYQVLAVASGAAVLDRSPVTGGLPNANPGTGTLGGALLTIKKALALPVAGNKMFVRYNASGYPVTSSPSTSGTTTPGDGQAGTTPPIRVIGYNLARGDIYQLPNGTWNNNANRPTINATNNGMLCTGNGIVVENFVVDNGSTAGSNSLLMGSDCIVRNCVVRNFGAKGINLPNNSAAIDCEVTGGLPGAVGINCAAGAVVANCNVHDNACPGIYCAAGSAAIVDNLIVNNTGAFSDGIQAGPNVLLLRNTVRGNGRHGIFNPMHTQYSNLWRNNILALNIGYGMYGATAPGIAAGASWDGNAFYANNGGVGNPQRLNADDTAANPINGVAPYTNRLDLILTASPFVNDTGATATSDFRLNNAAGGGALLRGLGYPQALQLAGAAFGASRPSFGVLQPPAGSGGVSRSRTIRG